MTKLLKFIIQFFNTLSEQNQIQTKLSVLIPKPKKSELINVNLPKKYLAMVTILAEFGIENQEQLIHILKNHKHD